MGEFRRIHWLIEAMALRGQVVWVGKVVGMRSFRLVTAGAALLMLCGCSSMQNEAAPTETEATTQPPEETAAAVPEPAQSEAELIEMCSDALYYWYPDGTYNHRFSTDKVTVESGTYIFQNNLLYGDYNDLQSNDDVRAYYDALVEDNDADIWCSPNSDGTYDMGIIGGISVENMTMEQAQDHRLEIDREITRLS